MDVARVPDSHVSGLRSAKQSRASLFFLVTFREPHLISIRTVRRVPKPGRVQ